MAKLNGIPLIQYVIQATESRFEKRVVVTRHDEVARLCHVLGAEAVFNNKPHRNDTVRLGMDAIGECDTVTFFQADQPLISPSSITALLCAAENTPEYIWRARRPRAIPLLDIRRTANAPIWQGRRLCCQTAQRVSEMYQGFKQMGALRC